MFNRGLVAVLAALLVLTGCSIVNGSGQLKSETRTVSGFTGIELSGTGEVTITQGDAESLTIEADDNVLPALTSEVEGSMLRLDTKPRTRVQTRNPIRYRVTVEDLSRIELSGSGSIVGADLELSTLEVDISGSGTMNLAGSADQQEIEVSGSGQYEAAQLPSRSVSIEISGSGKATVAAAEQLGVEISGSGTVTYSGEPAIDQSISGSGRLIKQ